MYDTITLRSPAITEALAAQIEANGTSRQAVKRLQANWCIPFPQPKLNGM